MGIWHTLMHVYHLMEFINAVKLCYERFYEKVPYKKILVRKVFQNNTSYTIASNCSRICIGPYFLNKRWSKLEN